MKTIDKYLDQTPQPQKDSLEKIRQYIRAAAPTATEIISYQVPTFKQEYALIAFAGFKNHCSVFTLSNNVMKALQKELEPYDCKGITIHFPIDKPLPASLIKKIVKIRLAEDAERAALRDNKKKKK